MTRRGRIAKSSKHNASAKSPDARSRCHLLFLSAVRMIWWFLILGVSTLIVVCVAIALYMRLRRHLQVSHAAQESERQSGDIEH
jgi:4-hydroxybenzoate polyprenyltransferase